MCSSVSLDKSDHHIITTIMRLLLFSCTILCNLMNCSMPGFPVLHHLSELAQTHVHWVGDAIQLSSVIPFSCLQSFPASGSILLQKTVMCHEILNHNICLSRTSYWIAQDVIFCQEVQILLCPLVSQECVLQSRCPLFQLVYLFTTLRFYLFPSFWRLWINSL